MTESKSLHHLAARFSAAEFAALGTGEVAYVKPMRSEDVALIFPEAPEIPAGLQLYALVAADGSPIVIADDRNTATANAWDLELIQVSLH